MNAAQLHSKLRILKSETLGFFQWWGITLLATAPRWLTNVFANDRKLPNLFVKSGSIFDRDGRPVVSQSVTSAAQINLVLDESEVFFRERWLPVASRHRWQAIMDFDFLSNAPFDETEIRSDVELLELDERGEFGRVRHAVCKCVTIGLALSAARKTGLTPLRISVRDQKSGTLHFNFLNQQAIQLITYNINKLNTLLIALIALGLVSIATASLDRNIIEIAKLEQQEIDLRYTAKPILQKHGEVMQLVELDEWLRHVFENPARFTNVYEDVTLHLPEGTWLESLSYSERSLFITGQTHDGDGMVESLEKSALIGRAEFTTPLIRNAQIGTDRFQMKLSLRAMTPPPAKERQM